MKILSCIVLSVIAIFLSGAAITVVLQEKPPAPPQLPVLGVCVMYNVDTSGTVVDSPVIQNGVVSCQAGSFVPVQPQAPVGNK